MDAFLPSARSFPGRVYAVSISHSSDGGDGVVTVWDWTIEAEGSR